MDISFYSKAFGARELMRFSNEDGSVHVAELEIGGAIFHIHEANREGQYPPISQNGTSVLIGLFVPDVDEVMEQAKAAGAIETSPAQSYDYGYRQGEFRDPFGHMWMIEKKI